MNETRYKEEIKERQTKLYIKENRFSLLTSRFNEKTWNENQKYRLKKEIGCIYCSPCPIANEIPLDSIMFILEMNNDKNRIEGIGMVRNKPYVNKYKVYEDGNYNRYVFTGKNYISREKMSNEEETIMKAFDILCFTGNRHMKRGQGLKKFPSRMLFNVRKKIDLVEFIKNMFKERIK